MNRIFCRPAWSAAAGALLLFLAGCGANHSHEDHAHEDEPKTAQITVWGKRHEIFAEHRLVVAEKPTKFVIHVTDLETLEPRRDGPITYRVRSGQDAPIEHVENAPARPGIYEPTLTFPKAGEGNVTILIPAEGKEYAVELPGIKVFANEDEVAHAEVTEAPEGIPFLKEQQWKVQTRIEPAVRRQLIERLQVPAQIRAKPGASAAIVAPLAGHLVLPPNGGFPAPGTQVEAGDVLALLQPRFSDAGAKFLEIESEFGRAEATLKQAEAAYERTRKLAAAQAKSERELQEAEAALASARARHSAATALRATYAGKSSTDHTTLELRAPIAGTVTTVAAGIGEPVTSDQAVFSILNPSTVWIEARVPEAAVSRLGNAEGALCEVLDGTERLIPIDRLVFIGLEVDAVTRTVPLVFELNNADARLRIGQSVRLHVATASVQDALAIPDSALVEEGGVFVAFVQVAGETFQKRELRLGIRDGQWVQVLLGITEGERVVTKGAYAIRLASASGAIPAHGHEH